MPKPRVILEPVSTAIHAWVREILDEVGERASPPRTRSEVIRIVLTDYARRHRTGEQQKKEAVHGRA